MKGHSTPRIETMQPDEIQTTEQLLPLVYDELRRLANSRMAQESAGHTLQPTALVHEAWIRLVKGEAQIRFANRAHFFAAAGEAMRELDLGLGTHLGYGRAEHQASHKIWGTAIDDNGKYQPIELE